MSSDAIIVFVILGVTVVLFVSERLRLDLVAMLALLALLLTGQLPVDVALSGFADPIVLMIAALFVVGAGLFHTGVADSLGQWLGRVAGKSERRLMVVIMLVTALLSAFMSSTGTVAVMLPVVVTLARGAGLSPSRLLMPLAFSSLLGGMLTLIGTPPNIVVSRQLASAGLEPFRFLSFAPPGLLMLAIGIVFMVTVGRRLLPTRDPAADEKASGPRREHRSGAALLDDYELDDNIVRIRVPEGEDLAGRTLAEAEIRKRFQGTVLYIERQGANGVDRCPVDPATRLAAGDRLYVQVSEDALEEVLARESDVLECEPPEAGPLPAGTILVEVLLTPRSRLIGQSLKAARFRDRYRANVLSVRREGRPLGDNAADVVLAFGDTLLVQGLGRDLSLLRDEHRDFVVVAEPGELAAAVRDRRRAPWAVAIMVAMLVTMTVGLVPNVVAVLAGAVAMVLTRAVRLDDVYKSVSWESVVLVAGIVPMAKALERSGGLAVIVEALDQSLGSAGILAVLASLFVLTSVLSQVMSNTATTLLVAPVALRLATEMEASPRMFLMTVALAASTAFATPIASPVNTLVLGPSGYRFGDFLKVGLPLQLLLLGATLLVVPLMF